MIFRDVENFFFFPFNIRVQFEQCLIINSFKIGGSTECVWVIWYSHFASGVCFQRFFLIIGKHLFLKDANNHSFTHTIFDSATSHNGSILMV
jgi:hypothetical protein